MERLGQAGLAASKFFGQAAANDAWNQVNDQATKLLYGDPNKSVRGPDGQPAPDTGIMGTKGRAAMDARPAAEKALDDAINNARGNLTTPEQQLEFDQISRRYRAMWGADIGRHVDQQSNVWFGEVNKTEAQQNLDSIARSVNDPAKVANFTNDLRHVYVKDAQLRGAQYNDKGEPDEMIKGAIAKADKDAAEIIVKGLAASGDYTRAQKALDNYKDKLGEEAIPLQHAIREGYNKQAGTETGLKYYAQANLNRPYANPSLPVYGNVTRQIPAVIPPADFIKLLASKAVGIPTLRRAENMSG